MYPVQLCRLPGRLREQARSHSWIVGCQVEKCRLGGRHRRQASSHTNQLDQASSVAVFLTTANSGCATNLSMCNSSLFNQVSVSTR